MGYPATVITYVKELPGAPERSWEPVTLLE